MRQRVTQLEGLLRSFIVPEDVVASPVIRSEPSASQEVRAPVNILGMLDSSGKSPSDVDMNDTDILLDKSGPSFGRLTLEETETSYVGNAHWAAVLDEGGNSHSSLGYFPSHISIATANGT
jgi:hypothetical protein